MAQCNFKARLIGKKTTIEFCDNKENFFGHLRETPQS